MNQRMASQQAWIGVAWCVKQCSGGACDLQR